MIRDQLRALVTAAIQAAQEDGTLPALDVPAPEIQRPKQADHGDYSSNVAMVAAATARERGSPKINPRQVAQAIVDHLPTSPLVSAVELAGPGFINLRLADSWLQLQVAEIIRSGSRFGHIERGRGERWQVEFVSANPTGPLHFGGARNAVLGDTLANVLEMAGYEVQREFYVNDGGSQFHNFVASLYTFYLRSFGREEPLPKDGYAGAYMADYAQRIVAQHQDRFVGLARDEALGQLRPLARQIVLADLAQDLERIHVHFDNWFSEQSLYDEGRVEEAVELLAQRGEVVKRDGAVWFLASRYPNNEKDEVLVRSSGAATYFAADIAYHYDKFLRRRFDRVVNVWAVDHQGHVPRMAAMMRAFGLDPDRLVILMYDLVKLSRDGVEVKMSKRSGEFLTLAEVVDEVGADPVRFLLLTRSPESTVDFDLALAVEQSNDNPVFTIQYSHARICSILAHARSVGMALPDADLQGVETLLAMLVHPSELALIRKMLELEEQIDLAVEKYSPHNLTHYALELARVFNGFYRDCRVVDPENGSLSQARILVARAAHIALSQLLRIMGMSAPESM